MADGTNSGVLRGDKLADKIKAPQDGKPSAGARNSILKCGRLELGRQVAVDLKPDADFH